MLRRRIPLFLTLLAAAYILSPVDAIPDVIPVFGWLDDGVVALAAVLPHLLRLRKLLKGKTVELAPR